MTVKKVRVALAQWRIGEPAAIDPFFGRLAVAMSEAARQGARIIVLPEYLSLELAATFDADTRGDFVRSLEALQGLRETWIDMIGSTARARGLYIVAGSFPVRQENGRYRNRSYLVSPSGGEPLYQDKLTLTGFERASGVIEPGDALKTFDTEFGHLGIAVCYDAEFPLYARAQARAGARLLLVPSCTDTEAGATRVRVGCMARALENQIYVGQAVTAGEAPWSPALDANTGTAALYAPSDRGMPSDGVVARAERDSTWVIAEVDYERLDEVRREGQVANDADWDEQLRPSLLTAMVEHPP